MDNFAGRRCFQITDCGPAASVPHLECGKLFAKVGDIESYAELAVPQVFVGYVKPIEHRCHIFLWLELRHDWPGDDVLKATVVIRYISFEFLFDPADRAHLHRSRDYTYNGAFMDTAPVRVPRVAQLVVG